MKRLVPLVILLVTLVGALASHLRFGGPSEEGFEIDLLSRYPMSAFHVYQFHLATRPDGSAHWRTGIRQPRDWNRAPGSEVRQGDLPAVQVDELRRTLREGGFWDSPSPVVGSGPGLHEITVREGHRSGGLQLRGRVRGGLLDALDQGFEGERFREITGQSRAQVEASLEELQRRSTPAEEPVPNPKR